MPALIPTDQSATVTWLGFVPHRDAPDLVTQALTEMALDWGGYPADIHAGVTRPSCSRVTSQYAKGTEIRNTRQISLVSAEELDEIAEALGLATIDPAWLGASVVLSGIADFSHIPPSARLQGPDGATLTVDMQNRPCQFPALTIDKAHPGHGKAFKRVADGKRGVTAWVERPGTLRLGDRVTLHVPQQRAWTGSTAGKSAVRKTDRPQGGRSVTR